MRKNSSLSVQTDNSPIGHFHTGNFYRRTKLSCHSSSRWIICQWCKNKDCYQETALLLISIEVIGGNRQRPMLTLNRQVGETPSAVLKLKS